MKNFIKGFRFTPSNYPAEVEGKYRNTENKVTNSHRAKYCVLPNNWKESVRVPKSILPCWIIFRRISVKECQLKKSMSWYMTSPQSTVPSLLLLTTKDFLKASVPSINDVVCHGIPSKTEILQSGDIINVDVSTIYKGYFSDASRMFMIGDVSPEMRKLVQVTKECMEIGIAAAQPWKQLGDVGAAIQEHAEKNGFNVVRDLCGHGVGMQFHEAPDVEHFGRRGTGMMIVPGMTFTIEPMINMGTYEAFVDEADGWTVCTDDGLPSAQWENMILITETGNEILTY